MRAWHRQVLKNTIKAVIPGREHLRLLWRRFSPYRTGTMEDAGVFENAVWQIELLRSAGFPVSGRRILELGSGWHPILPMVYLVAGADQVILTDVEYLLDARLLRSAIDFVLAKQSVLVERLRCCSFDRLRIRDHDDLGAMLDRLGLVYLTPYRTQMSGNESADLIVSHGVLEHIAPNILDSLTRDFTRILSRDGVMLHFIDNSDHYEQSDKTISRLNFLKFEDWVWQLCCIHPQSFTNRMRHSDYLAMFARHGFESIFELREVREKELAELHTMKLASRFRNRDLNDVAAISSVLMSVQSIGGRIATAK